MILRNLQAELILQLEHMPAVALLGPRQVGKTTLAQDIATTRPSIYLDLEDALDLQKARNMKSFFAENSGKLIVLDEVQRLPELFLTLRGIIDQQRRKSKRSGLFLCLGSAFLDLLRQTSESLAGRMAYVELHPVNVLEFAGTDPRLLSTLWVRGGFPESLLASSERFSLNWRMNFIKRIWNETSPNWVPGFRRLPCCVCGPCWHTSKAP